MRLGPPDLHRAAGSGAEGGEVAAREEERITPNSILHINSRKYNSIAN
jgi:hypothetical protein